MITQTSPGAEARFHCISRPSQPCTPLRLHPHKHISTGSPLRAGKSRAMVAVTAAVKSATASGLSEATRKRSRSGGASCRPTASATSAYHLRYP